MQVSIETTSGLERRLTIGIPANQVESEVEKRLKQAAKTVRLNGFRKGKVPFKVVKQRFGLGVRQEVLGEVINRSFVEAVQRQDVKPAGKPSIEATQVAEGKDIEFVATFEVYPDIEVGDVSAFEITRPVAEITDGDVDNLIEVLRKQQADWKTVERAAVEEDQVNIDYAGTRDGEPFDGGSAEGQDLIIGSKSMVEGFEAGITGMKAGEEKVLNVTFPDNYQTEALRGVEIEFTVKVNRVAERELPALDQAFFKKYGVNEGGEEKFREEVRSNLVRELNNRIKALVKDQVMNALLAANSVDLPKALVASEIEVLRGQMLQQFRGMDVDKLDIKSLLPDNMFSEQAGRRVALGLIVGEMVNKAQIKLDKARVGEMIQELASTYEDPEEVVKYYHSEKQLMSGVESAVLEDQVVEHILSLARVVDVQTSYDEVIQQSAQAPASGGPAMADAGEPALSADGATTAEAALAEAHTPAGAGNASIPSGSETGISDAEINSGAVEVDLNDENVTNGDR